MKYFSTGIVIILVVITMCNLVDAQAWKGKGRLTGTVKDQDGKPLEGVTIMIQSEEIGAGLEVKTNKDGKFTVMGIKGGVWNIDFKKEGYKSELITYQISSLAYNKPIEMTMQKAIAGAAPAGKEVDPGLLLAQEAKKLKEANDLAGAIGKYEAALQANPNLFWIYGEIGTIYEKMGQPDKAIASYQKFLEKEPNNATARLRVINILLDQRKVEDAKKELANINLDQADNAALLYNTGILLYNANQIKDAVPFLKKAFQLDPSMSDAYLQLGFALASPEVNDLEGAKQAFQKVIELDPASENAKAAKEFLDSIK